MVKHREGEIVLMVLAMNGVSLEIAKSIVHPTHVPLEGKAEAAQVRRASHLWPGGRLFRNRHDTGELGVGDMVEFSQEFDGFEVFPTAVLVGNPFALASGVIEVKHGGDGVD